MKHRSIDSETVTNITPERLKVDANPGEPSRTNYQFESEFFAVREQRKLQERAKKLRKW